MKKQTWKRNALQASLTLAAALGIWGAATIGVERAMANDEAAVETEATLDSLAVPVETVGPPAVEAPSVVPSEVPPSASSDCEECDEYCYQLVREPYFPWRSYYVKRPKKSEAERLADYLLEELPRRLDPNWQPTPIVSPTREGSKTLSEVLTDLAGENKLEDFASETIKNNYLTGRAQFFGLGKEKCDWTNGVKNLKFAQNSVIAQAELALAYALGSDADLEEWDVERSEIEKLAKEAADKYQNPFAQYALGMYYKKEGNKTAAEKYFDAAKVGLDKAIEESDDSLALTLRGRYYARQEDKDDKDKEDKDFDALADLITANSAFANYEAGELARKFGRESLAVRYYGAAAIGGWTDAELAYAEHLEKTKNWTEAFLFYGRAAEAKNPQTQFKYAFCCEKGPAYGAQQDWNKAREYYEAASKAGHAEATYRLGLMYADTASVRVQAWLQTSAVARWEEAKKLFEQATKAGYANAAYQVGMYYLAKTSEVKYDTVNTQNPTDPSVPQQRQANLEEAAKRFEMVVYTTNEKGESALNDEAANVDAAKELLAIYEEQRDKKEQADERDKLTAKIDELDAFVMKRGDIESIAALVVEKAQQAVGAKSKYDTNNLLRVAGRVVEGENTTWTEYDAMGPNQKANVAKALHLAILLTENEAQKNEFNGRLLLIADKDVGAACYVAMDMIAKENFAEAKKYLEKAVYTFDEKGGRVQKDGKDVLNAALPNAAKAYYELALCDVDAARLGEAKANWTDAETLLAAVAKIEIAKDAKDADELAKLQNAAAFELGKYLLGLADRSEDGKALLTAAGERGFAPALIALADAEKAVEKQKVLYVKASDLGSLDATLKLVGLAADEKEGLAWTKKAAEQGDKDSAYSILGYYKDNLTAENREAARKLLKLWLGEGDVKGKYELPKDDSDAFIALKKEIEEGEVVRSDAAESNADEANAAELKEE